VRLGVPLNPRWEFSQNAAGAIWVCAQGFSCRQGIVEATRGGVNACAGQAVELAGLGGLAGLTAARPTSIVK
jgi:hypothetical protein